MPRFQSETAISEVLGDPGQARHELVRRGRHRLELIGESRKAQPKREVSEEQ